MQKIPRHIIAIAVVLVVTGAVFYFMFVNKFQRKSPEAVMPQTTPVVSTKRELSTEVSYEVPGDKLDHLRFVVVVDLEGRIESIETLDAATREVPEKKKEFNEQVNVILKGKKLAELSKIDKVGKSTLTTEAFNSALTALRAQL